MKVTNDARTNRATLAVFTNALRRNGLTIPPAPELTFEAPTPPSRAEVNAAALKALKAGKDPAADKEVQRLATAYQLDQTGLSAEIDTERTKADIEHVHQHAPALVEELSERFTEAVETMRQAIPTTGHVDLSQGVQFTPGTGTEKLVATANAAEALNTATIITATWAFFMDAIGEEVPRNATHQRLWYCPATWDQFTRHGLSGNQRNNKHGREHNIWDMLNDGLEIELATTADEYMHRVEELETQELEAERRAAAVDRDKRPNYASML